MTIGLFVQAGMPFTSSNFLRSQNQMVDPDIDFYCFKQAASERCWQ
jgi:hypothetical protein